MKIYGVEWHLERESQIKTRYYASKDEAEARFEELKKALRAGSWLSLNEMTDNGDGQGFVSRQLKFDEIW